LSIKVFYDDIKFRIKGSRKVLKNIELLISGENKVAGDLSFIITDDESLRQINIEFLEHDYYTDVITFNYNEGKIINGEIYLSIDRIRENSRTYNASREKELQRVLIHGVLHLLGYDDKDEKSKSEMRSREDYWLNHFSNRNNGISV
jgi:rRNA maturation RNase YbeY